MSYNNFYFLNVSENGGSLFKDYMSKQVFTEFDSRDINYSYEDNQGWTPVNDDTFVVTSLQDPTRRSVGHFAHIMSNLIENGFPENHEEIPHPLLMDIVDFNSPNKSEFFTWFENCKNSIGDFQSKSLFQKTECHSLPIWQNEILGIVNEQSKSKVDTLGQLAKINIVLKQENITPQNIQSISQEIFNNFAISTEISEVTQINKSSANYDRIFSSIYYSLSQNELRLIYEMNPIDTEIYNTDSIFWQ